MNARPWRLRRAWYVGALVFLRIQTASGRSDLVTERVLGGHFVEPEAIAVELASSKRRLSVSPRPPGRSGSPASAISGPVDPT